VWTVGNNQYGQLGTADDTTRKTPVQVIYSAVVARVACGSVHTCALFESGAIRCFGYGKKGNLANGGTSDVNIPVDVTGYESSGAAHVGAGGSHTCLVNAVDGAVLCAGYNDDGQVGDGSSTDRLIMTQVPGLTSGYISVEGGISHTCAVSALGGIKWFVFLGGICMESHVAKYISLMRGAIRPHATVVCVVFLLNLM
jgi:alpha-tubulin suppressor-like RCC1 family protein